jgi:hypothetical protein
MNIAKLNNPLMLSLLAALILLLIFALILLTKRKKGLTGPIALLEESIPLEQFQVEKITFVTDPLNHEGLVSVQINAQSSTIAEAELLSVLQLLALKYSSNESNAILRWLTNLYQSDPIAAHDRVSSVQLINSATNQMNGFSGKFMILGKLSNVLFGETEVIARSTAQFHPEIAQAISKINTTNSVARLLAIDGLTYMVIEVTKNY